jgi:hypothetical protein
MSNLAMFADAFINALDRHKALFATLPLDARQDRITELKQQINELMASAEGAERNEKDRWSAFDFALADVLAAAGAAQAVAADAFAKLTKEAATAAKLFGNDAPVALTADALAVGLVACLTSGKPFADAIRSAVSPVVAKAKADRMAALNEEAKARLAKFAASEA